MRRALHPLWTVRRSLALDLRTLAHPHLSVRERAEFVALKYALLLRHARRPFRLGEDAVKLWGRPWFYDSALGLTGYQSILVRHYALLRVAGVTDVQTVLDVGANVGAFTALVRRMYPTARVFAFEPIPPTFACLDRNVGNDPLVRASRQALGEQPGSANMAFAPEDSAISSFSDEGGIEVEVTTVDEVCRENGVRAIDLVKIDVECFEDAVLDGARETLPSTRYLLLEVTIENNRNYTLSSLLARLTGKQHDFQLRSFRNYADRAEGPVPIADLLLENIHFSRPAGTTAASGQVTAG